MCALRARIKRKTCCSRHTLRMGYHPCVGAAISRPMGGSFVIGGRLIAAPTRVCESASRGRTGSSAPTVGCVHGRRARRLCRAVLSVCEADTSVIHP